jgi:N-acetyl-alpha-D-muramate 1-phosphate uridylyltransferase
MADSLAGVVLAAGAGQRLRPLTLLRPKPLCPMGDSTLLDRALRSVGAAVGAGAHGLAGGIAVNVHAGRADMEAHLAVVPDVHVSVEEPRALGTAGALAHLRPWLDGRSALVVNADTVHDEDLTSFVAGWDGERVRVLMTGTSPFGPRSGVVASIAPWGCIAAMADGPAGLWEALWRSEGAAGRLDAVAARGGSIDCGTPRGYLRGNLWLSGGASVIGRDAVVEGTVERCVVWPGASVVAGEHLVDAVRADGLTVLVR